MIVVYQCRLFKLIIHFYIMDHELQYYVFLSLGQNDFMLSF